MSLKTRVCAREPITRPNGVNDPSASESFNACSLALPDASTHTSLACANKP